MEYKYNIKEYDLKKIISNFVQEFPSVSEIYIFGSRRYKTRNTRSDLDLLVYSEKKEITTKIRDFAFQECPYLDFFIGEKGIAISCANNSNVSSTSKKALLNELNVLPVWSRKKGFSNEDIDWKFETLAGYAPQFSTLLNILPRKTEENSSKKESCNGNNSNKWKNLKDSPLAIIISVLLVVIPSELGVIQHFIIGPLKERYEELRNSIKVNYVPKESYFQLQNENASLRDIIEKNNNDNVSILNKIDELTNQKKQLLDKLDDVRRNSPLLTSSSEGPKEVTQEEIEIKIQIDKLEQNLSELYKKL